MKSCFVSCAVSIFALCLLTGCNSTRPAVVEQPPAAYQATPQSTPVKVGVTAAPKLPEVEEAVKRVFKDAAVIHPDYKSSVIVGDFNGDQSQDLAVVLKPNKLDEMNEQYSPWLLRDPFKPYDPRAPLRVEKDEPLLAVIHGYGANDWRDQQATQTFVLKNVVGSGMHVENEKEFVANNTGRKMPRPQGDLIGETVQGHQGYLYYHAATYSWYDPKTFKGEVEPPGAFHGRSSAMRR